MPFHYRPISQYYTQLPGIFFDKGGIIRSWKVDMFQGKEFEGSVPPIIEEIVEEVSEGGWVEEDRVLAEGAALEAYSLLGKIVVPGSTPEEKQRALEQFGKLVEENPWLERVKRPPFKSPLMRIRGYINNSPLPLGV